MTSKRTSWGTDFGIMLPFPHLPFLPPLPFLPFGLRPAMPPRSASFSTPASVQGYQPYQAMKQPTQRHVWSLGSSLPTSFGHEQPEHTVADAVGFLCKNSM